jgi:hypothetical protein
MMRAMRGKLKYLDQISSRSAFHYVGMSFNISTDVRTSSEPVVHLAQECYMPTTNNGPQYDLISAPHRPFLVNRRLSRRAVVGINILGLMEYSV